MTTPMTVYARVASRYAIDASDAADVDEFFLKIVPTLPEREREQIFKELIAASGLSDRPDVDTGEAPPTIPLIPLADPSEQPAPDDERHQREREQSPARRDTAFAKQYQRHYARVVRFYVRAFHLSYETAEELAQDVFVRFYNAMDEYQGQAEWAFLETIARSVVFNHIRSAQTPKRVEQVPPIDIFSPEEPDLTAREEEAIRRKKLYDAIESLSERDKLCIQLWLDGFSYHDIALVLETDPASVKERLVNSKGKLREKLGDSEADVALADRRTAVS